MSDIDIYKNGYLIDQDSYVVIPDWNLPRTEEPAAETEAEENVQNELESAEAEYKESDAEQSKPKAKHKAQKTEPAVHRKTREQIEKENQMLLVKIKCEVVEQAYTDARNSKRRELQECIDDVTEKFAELQEMHADYVARYTESLKYMALEIAQKIMVQKVEEDDKALAALVTQTIASIKQAGWISVDISNKLNGLVEHMKAELQKPEYEGKVELRPGLYSADTVRVNTENGTIDASIQTQIDNLRRAFENAEKE